LPKRKRSYEKKLTNTTTKLSVKESFLKDMLNDMVKTQNSDEAKKLLRDSDFDWYDDDQWFYCVNTRADEIYLIEYKSKRTNNLWHYCHSYYDKRTKAIKHRIQMFHHIFMRRKFKVSKLKGQWRFTCGYFLAMCVTSQ